MITNYDSRNSLEYYDIGSVYAFPISSFMAGVALDPSEVKDFEQMIDVLKAEKTVSEVASNYKGVVRVPGVVVDKERDGRDSRLVVILWNSIDGKMEYQYKKYACGYSGAGSDGVTLPLARNFDFSTGATRSLIGSLPKNVPVVKNMAHTGPVEKNAKASAHTGPVEKTESSAKHTGPVEKVVPASTHTGPVEKTEDNTKHTGPVEKL